MDEILADQDKHFWLSLLLALLIAGLLLDIIEDDDL